MIKLTPKERQAYNEAFDRYQAWRRWLQAKEARQSRYWKRVARAQKRREARQ